MNTPAAKQPQVSFLQDLLALFRYVLDAVRARLGDRRVLIAVGALGAGAGLALNWSWLTAIGLAPILVGVAPCAAMCALGLCMSRMGGRACSTQQSTNQAPVPAIDARPEQSPAAYDTSADPT